MQQANPGDDAKVMAGIHALLASTLYLQKETAEPQPGQTRMAGSTGPVQAASVREGSSQPGNWWERLTQAAGGTSAGMVKLIRDLESLDQPLARAVALPYGEYESGLEQLKAEMQRSPNPLPSLLLPAWEYVRSKELRALMNLAMVRAAVEYKLHGLAAMQSVTDPWGQGPFEFERFVFQGVDRGFELKSACRVNGWQEVLIFVEKEGPPFYVGGRIAGQARPATYPKD